MADKTQFARNSYIESQVADFKEQFARAVRDGESSISHYMSNSGNDIWKTSYKNYQGFRVVENQKHGRSGVGAPTTAEVYATGDNYIILGQALHVAAMRVFLGTAKRKFPTNVQPAPRVNRNDNGNGSMMSRYRALATSQDTLPGDAQASVLLGVDSESVSKMRYRLRKEGFRLVKVGKSGYKVVSRPQPPAPAKMPEQKTLNLMPTFTEDDIRRFAREEAYKLLVENFGAEGVKA